MVKIRLKSAHDAVIKMLKSKTFNSIAVDRISDRNDAIISDLFRRTAEGAIKGFYLLSDTTFKAIHRSPKESDKLQLSYGFYSNGELIPCGDIQLETAKDLIREGLPSGLYAIIE